MLIRELRMRPLIAAMILWLAACGNRVQFKEDTISPPLRESKGDEPTFAIISQEILQGSCLECHGHFSDYATVFAMRELILDKVFEDLMPKGGPPLNDDLKELLQRWVDIGAPEDFEEEEETYDREQDLL